MWKMISTALLLAAIPLATSVQAAPRIGDAAPQLAGPTLDGQTLDLSQFRGEVVVLNFWATWCGPCRKEMPTLDAYYQSHNGSGVEVIGISDDKPRDRDDVVKIAKGVSYPIAMAHDTSKNDFGHQNALPLTYVIDKSGTIRTIFTDDQSPITTQELDAAVTPLLK